MAVYFPCYETQDKVCRDGPGTTHRIRIDQLPAAISSVVQFFQVAGARRLRELIGSGAEPMGFGYLAILANLLSQRSGALI